MHMNLAIPAYYVMVIIMSLIILMLVLLIRFLELYPLVSTVKELT